MVENWGGNGGKWVKEDWVGNNLGKKRWVEENWRMSGRRLEEEKMGEEKIKKG